MHQIIKAAGDILKFNTWASKQKLRDWKDFSAPGAAYHGQYLSVRDHIAIIEQNFLSAYTEKPLGKTIHIDHFRKRDLYPRLTFDYANFLVDDLNDNYGACFKDNHAGVSKATFEGTNKIFCPVNENMVDYVEFMFDGTILPLKGLDVNIANRVEETIRVFNLNHKTLKESRRNIIKLIMIYRKEGVENEEIIEYMKDQGFNSAVDWALNIPL